MNTLYPAINRDPQWSLPSAIKVGQKFVPELGQTFDAIQYEVKNQPSVENPFGVIMVEVDPKNPNKGELQALVARQTGGSFEFELRYDRTNDADIQTLLKFATKVTRVKRIEAKLATNLNITYGTLHHEIRHFDEVHDEIELWTSDGWVTLSANVLVLDKFEAVQTETIVAAGTAQETGALVFYSHVRQLDEAHALRTTVSFVSYSGSPQSFTDYDFNPETGTLITTVTSWSANTSGVPATPSQSSSVVVKQQQVNYNWSLRMTATHASVTGYKLAVPSFVNMALPDTLESVEVEWNEAEGEGHVETDWQGSASGTSWSLSSNVGGSSESSAAVMPELVVVTKQTWGHNLSTRLFYMIVEKVNGEVTMAMVLSQLSSLYGVTASVWPVFKPRTYVCALSGGKVSVQSQISAHATMSYSSSSLSWSRSTTKGSKFDFSLTSGTRVIPNVLCSGITLNESLSKSVNATASLGFDSGIIPSFTTIIDPVVGDCNGLAIGNFTATDPPAIPTSGNYVVNMAARPFQNLAGFMMVSVEVLDASTLA